MTGPANLKIAELLNQLELGLLTVFKRLELDPQKYYHREYVYNLRSLTRELKQKMQGEHFSLEYIEEKTQNLVYCAEMIYKGYE